jgi:hypothetical protein
MPGYHIFSVNGQCAVIWVCFYSHNNFFTTLCTKNDKYMLVIRVETFNIFNVKLLFCFVFHKFQTHRHAQNVCGHCGTVYDY